MTELVSKDPKQRLIDSIRGWIHMDNLLENHTAQASNARAMRSKHEVDAIALMKQMRLDKSTIQVSGASLTIQKKTAPATLTWGYLEKEIPAWAARSGVSPTQSQSLIKWLHDHRDTKETESLKKSGPKTPALQ
jgi:hypothetical protein